MGVLYSSNVATTGLVLSLDAANVRSYPGAGTSWFNLNKNINNGTLSKPFASPVEAQRFGYPAGNYFFKTNLMTSALLLEYSPNYYEDKPFCCVFRSSYRSTATTNRIGLNIPMGGLLVQRDTLDIRAALYWSAPITYNSIGGVGNNTADSGYSPRRVILGFAGGHGIFATNQEQCNWGSATGAVGAGWDGGTCGSFPNDLVWGTGISAGPVYENRSGTWSHWVTWTDANNNGTLSKPFASPDEARRFGYPAGNYFFRSGSMSTSEFLEYSPNYYEGKPFCCVFRSPYRSTATTNRLGLNIPMGGLLVQRDTLDIRAALYWSTPITYNAVGGAGNNTADSGYSPRRVILGFAGGHGIFATNQEQCNWGSATGAVGAGWDGGTCGAFPNDLVWGTGRSDTATYENRSGTWSHWVTWTDASNNSELVIGNSSELINGATFNGSNLGNFIFDGVNDYVNIPNGMHLLAGTNQVTFSAWVFRSSAPDYFAGIISNKINGTDGIALLINPSGRIFFQYDSTTGVYSVDGGATLSINTWHNIVGIYDNVGLKTYLNGVLNNSANDAGKSIAVSGNMDIVIGAQQPIASHFPGRISDVKIYNIGLTAAEVLQNYNATKGRFEL